MRDSANSDSCPSVLLVDDDSLILEEMQATLARANISSECSSSGRDALRRLRCNGSILVVVTDLRMPHMDGFTLVEAIRDLTPHARQPTIIFISAHMDADAALRALRSNVVDFLPKPFSSRQMVATVEDALVASREEREQTQALGSMESVMLAMQEQIQSVSRQVTSMAQRRLQDAELRRAGADGGELPSEQLLAQLSAIIRVRELRQKHFPAELFSDPAWDMLMDLTTNRLQGHMTYVSSLAVGAQVPLTTALRYLQLLEQHGLIERKRDLADKRRTLVEITEKGLQQMHAFVRDSEALGSSQGISDGLSSPRITSN